MQANLKFSISNHHLQACMIPPGRERNVYPGTTDLICTRNSLRCFQSYCHLKIVHQFFFSSSTAGALSFTFYLWLASKELYSPVPKWMFLPSPEYMFIDFVEKKKEIKTSN